MTNKDTQLQTYETVVKALKNQERYEKLRNLCISEEVLGEWFCDMMFDVDEDEWCSTNCSGSLRKECVDRWMELSNL